MFLFVNIEQVVAKCNYFFKKPYREAYLQSKRLKNALLIITNLLSQIKDMFCLPYLGIRIRASEIVGGCDC